MWPSFDSHLTCMFGPFSCHGDSCHDDTLPKSSPIKLWYNYTSEYLWRKSCPQEINFCWNKSQNQVISFYPVPYRRYVKCRSSQAHPKAMPSIWKSAKKGMHINTPRRFVINLPSRRHQCLYANVMAWLQQLYHTYRLTDLLIAEGTKPYSPIAASLAFMFRVRELRTVQAPTRLATITTRIRLSAWRLNQRVGNARNVAWDLRSKMVVLNRSDSLYVVFCAEREWEGGMGNVRVLWKQCLRRKK